MVGARLPWSGKARDAITRMETPGKCTVFGWNQVCFVSGLEPSWRIRDVSISNGEHRS
jgi:hypothetical protein